MHDGLTRRLWQVARWVVFCDEIGDWKYQFTRETAGCYRIESVRFAPSGSGQSGGFDRELTPCDVKTAVRVKVHCRYKTKGPGNCDARKDSEPAAGAFSRRLQSQPPMPALS